MRRALPAVALLLAAAPAASAAKLTTDRPCYIPGQLMTVAGSAWAPGSAYSVFGAGIRQDGTADPAGAFSFEVEAPDIERSARPRTLTLAGSQDGAAVAKTTFDVVSFLVDLVKPSGKVTAKTRWRFSGFEAGRPIFVHVKRGKKVWTAKAGRGDAACGTLDTKLRRLPAVPARKIGFGRYRLFVDNRSRFTKGGLQYRASITIDRS